MGGVDILGEMIGPKVLASRWIKKMAFRARMGGVDILGKMIGSKVLASRWLKNSHR
jgi:hypothetical protein